MRFENAALLLIGFQNDYFADDGVLHAVIEETSRINRTLDNTLALLERLRDTPTLLVATPILFTPDYSELVNPVGILEHIQSVEAFKDGTAGARTIDQLEPFRDRLLEIPGKRGLDAFSNTDLDQLLNNCDVTDVVLAGAVTSLCIDSTARSATERGYRAHILSDCTSARTHFEQEFYCEQIFPLYANVLDSQQLLECLATDAHSDQNRQRLASSQ